MAKPMETYGGPPRKLRLGVSAHDKTKRLASSLPIGCQKSTAVRTLMSVCKFEKMRRAWEAERDALATVRRFNARLSARGFSWFWPKIGAALTARHPWLVIACDSCGTVVDLDLRVKPRDPEASIRVALKDVRCPRCNGHSRPQILALASHPSS